jgi:Protein of unknown function (DUF2905)
MIGKLLIIMGIVMTVIGIFLTLKISIPFLGKLPGDISITGENYQIYFPLVTCILVSIILSILFYLFGKS